MSSLYSKQTLLGKDDEKKFQIPKIILAKRRMHLTSIFAQFGC